MWPELMGFNLVLIVAVVFGTMAAIPILIASLLSRNAQKKREAELIRLAIEKGQPIPEFPIAQPSKYGTLKASLIWLAIGLGIVLLVLFQRLTGWSEVSFGFIPFLIGIALLISWLVEKKSAEKEQESIPERADG